MAIRMVAGDEERFGWLLATQVRTIVAEGITEDSAAPDAPRLIETRVELTQVAPSQSAGMREGYLYLRLSLMNRDLKPVDYDASKIMLEIDGQGTSHAPAPRQGYSSMHYVQVDASRKAPHELDYLETGTILPGGSVTGWLRFQVPSFREASELATKTWVLSGKIGKRSLSVDLFDVERRALELAIRPSKVDPSVQVVEFGSRLNGLNVGQVRQRIDPLIAKEEGAVIMPRTGSAMVDQTAAIDLRSPPTGRNLLVWVLSQQSSMNTAGMYFASRCPTEAVAVMQVLGARSGTGAELTPHLRDPDVQTRVAAARALTNHVQEAGVVDALVKAWEDEQATVRSAVVSALTAASQLEATNVILKAVGDDQPLVRRAAAGAAGSHPVQLVTEPLIHLLDDSDPNVVIAACNSLSRLKADKAVEPLQRLFRDGEDRTAAAAIDALRALGQLSDLQAARSKLGRVQLPSNELELLAREKDKEAVPALIRLTQSSESSYYTNQLVRVLGDIGDPRAIDPLVELLKGGSLSLTELPVALGKLGDKRAIDPLKAALKKTAYAGSRSQSVYEALLMLEAPGILETIVADLERKKDRPEANQLIALLGRAGGQRAIEIIEPYLDSPQHHLAAASSLLQIDSAEAIKPLKSRLLKENYPHAENVLSQLARQPAAYSSRTTDPAHRQETNGEDWLAPG